MIDFFKRLLSKVNFDSENENLNKINKIIYGVIILCAIAFIGLIIFFVIKQWPNFVDSVTYNWNESKTILNGFNK